MFVDSNYKFEITISRITISNNNKLFSNITYLLPNTHQIHTKYTPNTHQYTQIR